MGHNSQLGNSFKKLLPKKKKCKVIRAKNISKVTRPWLPFSATRSNISEFLNLLIGIITWHQYKLILNALMWKKINVLIFKTSPINLLMILLINYGSFLFQKTVMIWYFLIVKITVHEMSNVLIAPERFKIQFRINKTNMQFQVSVMI